MSADRTIYPGLRFYNEYHDLCEFRQRIAKGEWEGIWHSSKSSSYAAGNIWRENETDFWEMIDSGEYYFELPENTVPENTVIEI